MTPTCFRELMATFPTGVAVVTADDGTPHGMTCSSVCSVTLTPPTLLVSMRSASPTLRAMLDAGRFAVNLLRSEARGTAELFASGNPDRFDLVRWKPSDSGPHLVEDAHAIADCSVADTHLVGDHLVVFGAVFHVRREDPAVPLLYGLRRYASWS
ncbi:monooxygenase [Lentzea sp. NBRC 105346]|uniref:flavin reductase family protein n=1 Tax=Lentzea sp. NBRC 105346 TaxID=3032205 RepID=UPI0024A52CA5|nr:flavin reductase family protein [Lentzea sp. NBRC 105346]GLZ28699.1 monooxygenase [Lentzea sp. NBRC 105346]